MKGFSGHSHHKKVRDQMELAAQAEAKRRRDGGGNDGGLHDGVLGNLIALAVGLSAMGVLVLLAWRSGLLG